MIIAIGPHLLFKGYRGGDVDCCCYCRRSEDKEKPHERGEVETELDI